MDVKKLEVVVTQTGIRPTASNLDLLVKAASNADPVLRTLTNTLNMMKASKLDGTASNMGDMARQIKSVTLSMEGISKATEGFKGVSGSFTAIANAAERLVTNSAGLEAVATQLRNIKTELLEMKGLSNSLPKISTSAGSVSAPRASSGGGGGEGSDKATAASKRLMAQLEREAYLVDHTRSEWMAYRAEKHGVVADAAPFIAKLKATEGQMNTVGTSAKQTAWAMRMVPAQMTDIVTQLAGGQNPLLIMIQQGGQLRDMFQGFGPMFKAVGGMVLNFLVNPFVLAAAAIGSIAAAYLYGSKEQEAFNKAMSLTNGYMGISISQFTSLQSAIGGVSGSKSAAADALNTIAASGKITGTNIEAIATASLNMEKATGQSIQNTVKEFASLAEAPAKGLETLNEKYHFLSASVYKQVAALEAQGRSQEAVTLAQGEYAKALDSMATEAISKLGTMETAWLKIKKVVSSVKDAILDIGRSDSTAQQITLKDAEIKKAQAEVSMYTSKSSGGFKSNAAQQAEAALSTLLQQRAVLQESLKLENRTAEQKASSIALQEEGIKGVKFVNTLIETSLSKQEQKKKAILQLEEAIKNAQRRGDPFSPADIASARAGINKRYEDKAAASAAEKERKHDYKEDGELASVRAIIEAQEQRAAAIEKYGIAADKVSQYALKADALELKSQSENATFEEAYHAKRLARGYREAAVKETRNKASMEFKQAEQDTIKLAEEHSLAVSKIADGYAKEAEWIGFTTKEKEKAKALWDIEIEKQNKLLELKLKLASVSDNKEATAEIQKQIKDTQNFYDVKYTLAERNINKVQQEMSVTDAARLSFKQYTEDMGSSNDIMKSSFTSMFNSTESALTSFVNTGKFSFKDFARSMAQSVATMLIKLALLKGAMALVGMMSSASVPANADTTIPMQPGGGYAKGGAFTETGVSAFANGGAFTNSIVNKPTAFKFANGAGFAQGVMGEAGPEAVMPLTRTANGKLGVATTGSGSGGNQISIEINVESNGNSTESAETSSNNSKAMATALAAKMKQVIVEELRPGGMLSRTGR